MLDTERIADIRIFPVVIYFGLQLFIFRVYILTLAEIMFSYMCHIYEHVTQQWKNNPAYEDSINQPSIISYIDSSLVQPLIQSYYLAHMRTLKRPNLCEYMSSICTEIVSRLPDLYTNVHIQRNIGCTRQFDILALATIYCNLGIIYKDYEEMRNLGLSLKYLCRALELLNEIDLDFNTILIAVKAIIAISVIQETQPFLNEGIKLCLEYLKQNSFEWQRLYTYLADTSMAKDVRISLKLLYQNMLERMETFYSASGEMDEWIKTVHDCLNKWATIFTSPYDVCKWYGAAIAISMYFIKKLRFTEARNCLCATEYMLGRIQGDQSNPSIHHEVKISKAKLAAVWLTYATYILRESERLRQAQQQTSSVPNQEAPQELLLFTSLNEHLTNKEKEITASCVSNMVDADQVAKFALEQYRLATLIFREVGSIFDDLDAISNYTSVLKYVASFTTDEHTQVYLHHRRSLFFHKIYLDYKQEVQARCVPVIVAFLVTILEMWQEATKTLLFEINRSETFASLRNIIQEELQYIISALDYYIAMARRCGL